MMMMGRCCSFDEVVGEQEEEGLPWVESSWGDFGSTGLSNSRRGLFCWGKGERSRQDNIKNGLRAGVLRAPSLLLVQPLVPWWPPSSTLIWLPPISPCLARNSNHICPGACDRPQPQESHKSHRTGSPEGMSPSTTALPLDKQNHQQFTTTSGVIKKHHQLLRGRPPWVRGKISEILRQRAVSHCPSLPLPSTIFHNNLFSRKSPRVC